MINFFKKYFYILAFLGLLVILFILVFLLATSGQGNKFGLNLNFLGNIEEAVSSLAETLASSNPNEDVLEDNQGGDSLGEFAGIESDSNKDGDNNGLISSVLETVSGAVSSTLSGLGSVLLGTSTSSSTTPATTTEQSLGAVEDKIISEEVLPIKEEKVETMATGTKVTIIVENLPPAGEIIYPRPQTTLPDVVETKVKINEVGAGIKSVLFYSSANNGTLLGEVRGSNSLEVYELSWNKGSVQFDKYRPHYIYATILSLDGQSFTTPWVPVSVN